MELTCIGECNELTLVIWLLALVDHGSALSPIFRAAEQGKKIHVWIDETRPRSQGARLTAWELYQERIPHTIIADNAAGSLMSQGRIDLVLTGADRIAGNGDFANKIGTLEKAVLAKEFGVPFYVAAPLTTFDLHCLKGEDIVIEDRDQEEILWMEGPDQENILRRIQVTNPGSRGYNPAFDVTPAAFCKFYYGKGIFTFGQTSAFQRLRKDL